MKELITQTLLATFAVTLFQFKNPHKAFIGWVSVFVVCVFLTIVFNVLAQLNILSITWSKVFWLIATLGLTVFYFLRFQAKKTKKTFDYLKWIGIILLILSPADYFIVSDAASRLILHILSLLTVPILISFYIYDRFILNTEPMKRRFVIILSIQTVLILLLLTYAFIQKGFADSAKLEALENKVKADKIYAEMSSEIEMLKAQLNQK